MGDFVSIFYNNHCGNTSSIQIIKYDIS